MSKQHFAIFIAITIIIGLGSGYGGGYIYYEQKKNTAPSPIAPLATLPQDQNKKPLLISLVGKVLEIGKDSLTIGVSAPSEKPDDAQNIQKVTVAFDSSTSFLPMYAPPKQSTPKNSSINDIKKGYYVHISYLEEKKTAPATALSVIYSETDPNGPGAKK